MEDLRNKLDEVTATIADNYKSSEANTSEFINKMIEYNPIEDLHNRLEYANIPHVFKCEIWPGFGIFGDRKPKDQFLRNQVCYPVDSKDDVNGECLFDAIWQFGSYGKDHELETWHKLGVVDEYCEPCIMTVEEAFDIIANHYKLSEANKEEI